MALVSTRRIIGLLLLLCVVFIWVGSSFLVSNLFGKQEFNRPFFITYLNTGTFSLYLVGIYIRTIRNQHRSSQRKQPDSDSSVHRIENTSAGLGISSNAVAAVRAEERVEERGDSKRDCTSQQRDTGENSPLVTFAERDAFQSSGADRQEQQDCQGQQEQLTRRETVKLGVSFCILWFSANITQNASLAYTSVANSSILCSTSGLFTLAIGAAAGVEQFSTARVVAVLLSVLGVYSVMYYGSDTTHAATMPLSWVGDFLALLSAALYGCYTTLLKLRIGDESRLDAPLFFGSVGLANIVLLWPGFVLLHVTGIEPFMLPGSGSVWVMIVVNALVGTFLSDYLWLLSVLMTSPLIVTLGLSLTIPLSMAGDVLFKGLQVGLPYYVGALFILIAFIVANV